MPSFNPLHFWRRQKQRYEERRHRRVMENRKQADWRDGVERQKKKAKELRERVAREVKGGVREAVVSACISVGDVEANLAADEASVARGATAEKGFAKGRGAGGSASPNSNKGGAASPSSSETDGGGSAGVARKRRARADRGGAPPTAV